MKTFIKVLTILAGLFILANGVAFMFKPELVMSHSSISATNAFGMSTVRGLIGGSMVATAALVLIAVVKSKFALLHPAALILLSWTLGRVVSLIIDGFDKGVLVGGIAISLIMAILLMVSHKILSNHTTN